MSLRLAAIGALAVSATLACSSSHSAPHAATSPVPAVASEGPRVLARLGDVMVVSYAPKGFDQLTPRERALAYHLSEAALATDAIFTMQSSRFAPAAKRAVHAMLAKAGGLEPGVRERLVRYRQLLFVHHGLHNHRNSQKYVPPIARDEFERAARATGTEVSPALLAAMFEPEVEPMLVNKNPGPGKDPIAESAANHYEGITGKDLATYREKYELNGRLMKQGGAIVEQVYRAGDAHTPAGIGAAELGRAIVHLQKAIALAPDAQKRALERLVQYLRTGDNERMREHDIAWLGEAFPIDYIFGFLGTYDDVRQRKGSFMAFVSMPDSERNPPLQGLSRSAAYFEQKLPFDPAYKRDVFRAPAVAAVIPLAAAAAAGPLTFGGMNLPDAQDLKEQYGTKNFIVSTSSDVRRAILGDRRNDEFVPLEARAEIRRCASQLVYAFVAFHEVTGHGSGKVSASLGGDPSKILGANFGALEEGRADLVADYLTGDPKTVELGLLPDAGCARIFPTYRTTSMLTGHLEVPRGEGIEEEHLRGAFIEFGVLRDKGVISVEKRDGKTFFVVKDPDAWRRAARDLLTEYQRIKATGDHAAFEALVQKYGTRLDPRLRDEVVARYEALRLPKFIAVIPPTLTPIVDANGKVLDARAERVTSLDAYIDGVER